MRLEARVEHARPLRIGQVRVAAVVAAVAEPSPSAVVRAGRLADPSLRAGQAAELAGRAAAARRCGWRALRY